MIILYENGDQFLNDNKSIIQPCPLETAFFVANAKLKDVSEGFAVKVLDGDNFLLCMRYLNFPMILYGSESLCEELALCLFEHKLTFERVLAGESLASSFLLSYEKLKVGTHSIVHVMEIMQCKSIRQNSIDFTSVESALLEDAEEIASLVQKFRSDTSQPKQTHEELLQRVKDEIKQFALIRADGKIVSIAKRTRETEQLCCISSVYTCEEFRGKSLARQVVTWLTEGILRQGKLPYLFVDKANPISNHLYQSIGYE